MKIVNYPVPASSPVKSPCSRSVMATTAPPSIPAAHAFVKIVRRSNGQAFLLNIGRNPPEEIEFVDGTRGVQTFAKAMRLNDRAVCRYCQLLVLVTIAD